MAMEENKNAYRPYSLVSSAAFFAFVAVLCVSVVLLCGPLYGREDLLVPGACLIPVWVVLLAVTAWAGAVWHGRLARDKGPGILPH